LAAVVLAPLPVRRRDVERVPPERERVVVLLMAMVSLH
jgi:hypothetical protein